MASYSPSSDHSAPLKGAEARDRVAVLVDEIAEAEALEIGDTAPAQSTASVIHVLDTLGYEPVELALQADRPDAWLRQVIEGDFHLAFNLCETVGGQSDSEHLPAAAIELLGLPKTGATAATLLHCLDKDLCSAVLQAHDISVPEWGSMLAEAKDHLASSLWPALGPGVAISLTILGFNLLGDGLRDALDPRLAGSE